MAPDGKLATFQGGAPLLATVSEMASALGVASLTNDVAAAQAAIDAAIRGLELLADDGVITVTEKITQLIPLDRQLEATWRLLDRRADDLFTNPEVTAARDFAATTRGAWIAYRNGLVPAWDDTLADTPVSREIFDARLDDYRLALTAFTDALRAAAAQTAQWSGVIGPGKPEDNATVGMTPEEKAAFDELIEHVGDITAPEDAVAAAEAARDAALLAQQNAENASGQAQAAQSAAEDARAQAVASATAAGTSANSAGGSATTAANAVTLATQQADEAGQKASIAQAQATIATTKAGEASTSASNAATSEANALGNKNAAYASQQVTASNADAAAGSATAAADSASSAATSKKGADTSAAAAQTSATTATTKAGEASTSATAAATSATNASGSANTASTSSQAAATSAGNAAGSASAASTSAQTATTKATDAGNSATAAAQAKVDAQAARGDAQSAASASQGYAASASGSAAAALSSAAIAASVSSALANKGATFSSWPDGAGTIPDYWFGWGDTTNTRAAGIVGRYAFRQSAVANAAETGLFTTFQADPGLGGLKSGTYVIEADVTLNAGAFPGAGVLLRGNRANGDIADDGYNSFTSMASDVVPDGATGNGVAGQRYRFTKMFTLPADTAYITLYLMTQWAGFGTRAAKTLTWNKCGVRPASQQEIAAGRADTNSSAALAQISQSNSAQADVNSAFATSITNVNTRVGDAEARISNTETAVSDGRFAAASTVNTLTASYNGTKATVDQQVGVIAGLQQRTAAFWQVGADAGNGRRQLTVYADANGGGGVDIVGDLSLSGNLLVGGSITTSKIANNAVTTMLAAEASSTLQVPFYTGVDTRPTPTTGLTLTLPNATGASVRIDFDFTAIALSYAPPGQSYPVYFYRVVRIQNGVTTTVYGWDALISSWRKRLLIDTPAANSNATYALQFATDNQSSMNSQFSVTFQQFFVTEVKR